MSELVTKRRECCQWLKDIFNASNYRDNLKYRLFEYVKHVVRSDNVRPSTFNEKECDLFLQSREDCHGISKSFVICVMNYTIESDRVYPDGMEMEDGW